VRRIYKTARKLQQLIGKSSKYRGAVDDIVADLDKQYETEKANARFEALLNKLAKLSARGLSDSVNSQHEITPRQGILDGLAALATKPRRNLGPNDLSANEWLAGVHLPEVFERHLNDKVRYSCDAYSDSDKVRGRYIGFAEAAFGELRVRYSRKAIANARLGVGSIPSEASNWLRLAKLIWPDQLSKYWSGRRESNPRMQLGKLPFYH
jgi:hypothetical protein